MKSPLGNLLLLAGLGLAVYALVRRSGGGAAQPVNIGQAGSTITSTNSDASILAGVALLQAEADRQNCWRMQSYYGGFGSATLWKNGLGQERTMPPGQTPENVCP